MNARCASWVRARDAVLRAGLGLGVALGAGAGAAPVFAQSTEDPPLAVRWTAPVGAHPLLHRSDPDQPTRPAGQDPADPEPIRAVPTVLPSSTSSSLSSSLVEPQPSRAPTAKGRGGAGLAGPGLPTGRRLALGAAYAGLYGGAAKVGSRLGLSGEFRVMRLESAWAIDVFGHLYATMHTARVFAGLHRWAGDDPRTARRRGAWSAAFGSLLYMETINGFMPGVRFDWVDPLSNAGGAWLADGGQDFAREHHWARRLSLELGYDSWSRVLEPDDQSGPFTRIWHDYPNMRFGVGYGVGPVERPWVRLFATYGVSSLEIEELRNEWGLGIELKPHHWIAPWVERVPGGGTLLAVVEALDRLVLVPGLYVELVSFETGPFSGREPFDE